MTCIGNLPSKEFRTTDQPLAQLGGGIAKVARPERLLGAQAADVWRAIGDESGHWHQAVSLVPR
jgi:hypothetical protein